MKYAIFTCCLSVLLVGGCKSKEEQLKAEEAKGTFIAAKKAKFLEGVGKSLKKEGAKATETLAEGTGKMLLGVKKGIDKGLSTVPISTAAALTEKQLKAERAERMLGKHKHQVKVYIIFDAPFDGALVLKAFDDAQKEVGRATVTVQQKANTAKYVLFSFDALVDLDHAASLELLLK